MRWPEYLPHSLYSTSMPMAKPNYQFDKRQRELEKKKKQAAKASRKAAAGEEAAPADSSDDPAAAPEATTPQA